MKKKLIFLAFLLLGGGLFCYQPCPVSAKGNLFFRPGNINTAVGERFVLELMLETDEPVVGLDLDLSFDPALIAITKVLPSTFFKNPQIATNTIKEGVITFSIFSREPKAGSEGVISLEGKILLSNFSSTMIAVKTDSVLAGLNGKKIAITQSTAAIAPSLTQTVSPQPTPETTLTLSPETPNQNEPTIFVEESNLPTPAVKATLPQLTKIALLLLLLGAVALFIIKIAPK